MVMNVCKISKYEKAINDCIIFGVKGEQETQKHENEVKPIFPCHFALLVTQTRQKYVFTMFPCPFSVLYGYACDTVCI